ncbi:hypothetical protein GQ457_12G015950 [Hibiscus cannabinus]
MVSIQIFSGSINPDEYIDWEIKVNDLFSHNYYIEDEVLCGLIQWDQKGNNLVKWEVMKEPVDRGGLGFRDLEKVNFAFLMKIGFRLITDEHKIWLRVLRANDGLDDHNQNVCQVVENSHPNPRTVEQMIIIKLTIPNEFLAIGDRWELFGVVGTLFPANSAILEQWVSVPVLRSSIGTQMAFWNSGVEQGTRVLVPKLGYQYSGAWESKTFFNYYIKTYISTAKYKCDGLVPLTLGSGRCSRLWAGIRNVWDAVCQGLIWCLRDGCMTDFLFDYLVAEIGLLVDWALKGVEPTSCPVIAFVTLDGSWDLAKLRELILEECVSRILAIIPPCLCLGPD